MINKQFNRKINFFIFLLLIFFFGVSFWLYDLMIINFDQYQRSIYKHHTDNFVQRVDILDRNEKILAHTKDAESVWINGLELSKVNNKNKIIEEASIELSMILDEDYEKIKRKLNTPEEFVWIARRPDNNQLLKLKQFIPRINNPTPTFDSNNKLSRIPYMQLAQEGKRIYPFSSLFAHVVGLVGRKDYNDQKFSIGIEAGLKQRLQNLKKGSVLLSVDQKLQLLLTNELMEIAYPRSSGIIMDINNGEILALSSLPNFDPNNVPNVSDFKYRNGILNSVYFMWDIARIITLAIALEEGLVNEETLFDISKPIFVKGDYIRDPVKKNKPYTIEDCVLYSSNICFAQISQLIGAETLKKYYKKLGLFERLPLEVYSNKPKWSSEWEYANPNIPETIGIGSGLGFLATPLHWVNAYANLLNTTPHRVNPTFLMHKKIKRGLFDFSQPVVIDSKEDLDVKSIIVKSSNIGSAKIASKDEFPESEWGPIELIFSNNTATIIKKILRKNYSQMDKSLNAKPKENPFLGGQNSLAGELVLKNENEKFQIGRKYWSYLSFFPFDEPQYIMMIMAPLQSGPKKIALDTTNNIIEKMIEIDEYNFSSLFKSATENNKIANEIKETMGLWFSSPNSNTQ